jgi:hypothetical protein
MLWLPPACIFPVATVARYSTTHDCGPAGGEAYRWFSPGTAGFRRTLDKKIALPSRKA